LKTSTLVLHFPVLHFPALLFGPPNSSPACPPLLFNCPSFFSPAFSVAPYYQFTKEKVTQCSLELINDAIFIVRKMQENFRVNGKLYSRFVDLEKAFDRIPRKVIRWAMRKLGVEE